MTLGSRSWLATVLLLALAHSASAQSSTPPATSEGALQNDVFLPTSLAAEKSLAAGDVAWQRWVTGRTDTGARTEAFEAWHSAIALASAGESVAALVPATSSAESFVWPDPGGTAFRRTESVETAVLRRLFALSPEDRAAFAARFEPVARAEIAHAESDLARCAQVERAHPLTSGAAEAALRLADASFEIGSFATASGWLTRARVHADSVADSARRDRLRAALDRRGALVPASEDARDELGAARALQLVTTVALPPPASEEKRTANELPRTGIAIAPSGAIVVQTAERIHWLDTSGQRTTIDPSDLASPFSWVWTPAIGRASAGVPLRPVTDGTRIWTTIGRSQADRGNVLACIAVGEDRARASIAWGYWSGGFREASGRETPLSEVLGPGIWSFEPGPLRIGAELWVSARQWIADSNAGGTIDEGRTRAWCLCLDAATGTLRWSRLLAVGADARFDAALTARLRSPRGMPGPAQPLLHVGSSVFVATEVGAGVCLDLCDGRPRWSLRNQREPTSAHARMVAPVGIGAGIVLWSPGDSRFSYLLDASSSAAADTGLLAAPPWPSIDIVLWAGGSSRSLVAVARRGARAVPVTIDPIGGGAVESWPFASEETPGDAHVSSSRAWIATDRALYLLDRTRDLALLDREALSAASGPTSLALRGARVFAAGPRGLWVFEAR
ncbi:MAG: hypothetical protein ACKVWV_11265 [Planctomycetota bacterium]